MPQTIFLPFPPLILNLGIMWYAIIIGCWLASCGDIQSNQLVWDRTLRGLMFGHFFVCLWTMLWVNSIQLTTLAGAVAEYYWTRDKAEISRPVLKGFKRAMYYHLGTMVVGSLLLAIV